jgi:hypothetical protein
MSYHVQEIVSSEDIGTLIPGDVIRARINYRLTRDDGKDHVAEKDALVVEHPEHCKVISGELHLAFRYSGDGICHVYSPVNEISVDGEIVHIDAVSGRRIEVIRIWGEDWIHYDSLMRELIKSGLEEPIPEEK